MLFFDRQPNCANPLMKSIRRWLVLGSKLTLDSHQVANWVKTTTCSTLMTTASEKNSSQKVFSFASIALVAGNSFYFFKNLQARTFEPLMLVVA